MMAALRHRRTFLSFFTTCNFLHNCITAALARCVHLAVNSAKLVKEVELKDQRACVKYQVSRFEVKQT